MDIVYELCDFDGFIQFLRMVPPAGGFMNMYLQNHFVYLLRPKLAQTVPVLSVPAMKKFPFLIKQASKLLRLESKNKGNKSC